jgi:hypothetical protein
MSSSEEAATPGREMPQHLQRLFERMPLVSIGRKADLSKEAVEKFLKVLDEDMEKFATYRAPE